MQEQLTWYAPASLASSQRWNRWWWRFTVATNWWRWPDLSFATSDATQNWPLLDVQRNQPCCRATNPAAQHRPIHTPAMAGWVALSSANPVLRCVRGGSASYADHPHQQAVCTECIYNIGYSGAETMAHFLAPVTSASKPGVSRRWCRWNHCWLRPQAQPQPEIRTAGRAKPLQVQHQLLAAITGHSPSAIMPGYAVHQPVRLTASRRYHRSGRRHSGTDFIRRSGNQPAACGNTGSTIA